MRTPILLIYLTFGFSIIYHAEAYPAENEPADSTVYNSQHCIQMTPEIENKITTIVTRLSDYLYNLTVEYEVFDIRLLKIEIEAHLDDEIEEKDTEIQLVVNDCSSEAVSGQEVQENDDQAVKNKAGVDFADSDGQSNNYSANEYPGDDSQAVISNNSGDESDVNNSNTNYNEQAGSNDDSISNSTDDNRYTSTNQESYTTKVALEKSAIDVNDIQPSSDANFEVDGPVLVRLDLDKNGNKLISGTQMKRGENVPLILYIQRVLGNIEYLFGN